MDDDIELTEEENDRFWAWFQREKAAEFRIELNAYLNSIGRNDLCPCGSGKKYKKCCLE